METEVSEAIRRLRSREPSGDRAGTVSGRPGSEKGLAGFRWATTCHRSTSPRQTGSSSGLFGRFRSGWRLRPMLSLLLGSFPPIPHFLPPVPFPLILLLPSYPFLECRRRGAAGRLRRCLGRGAATTPGTALGPGGCHPRGRPGLSRAPARTPQSPKSHWEVWAGEARNGGGSKGRFCR